VANSGARKQEPSRPHASHGDHSQLAIEPRDHDRIPHPDRVNGTGSLEQQSATGGKPLTVKETAHALPPGLGDIDLEAEPEIGRKRDRAH
jgi:hypothetical protein